MPAAAGGQASSAAAGGQAGTEYVLTLSCPDRVGIVHAVAAYLHQAGCNVLDSQQFGDRIGGRFFMRVHVETVPGAPVTYESLYGGFAPVAAEFGMEWELHDTAVQPRVLIMVSKAGHCLNDLLYRRAAESLRIDVPLVVGNHPDLAPLAAAHGVPFEHLPAGPASAGPASAGPARLALTRWPGSGPRDACSTWSASSASTSWCWPVTCGSCRRNYAPRWPAASSTSTTLSCPASKGRGRTIRRTRTA